MRQEGIRSNIKGNTQEEVSAALIELAAQFSVGHIKLEEDMARWERHLRDFAYVPGTDQ